MNRNLLIAALLLLSFAADAKIHRSKAAVAEFVRTHPCPSNHNNHMPCRGWIVDHINPLACGGPDTPANMQWQTVADAKAKDKWERKNCQPHASHGVRTIEW